MLNNLYINGEIIKHCNNIEKYKQFAKKLLFINTDTKLYKIVINIDNKTEFDCTLPMELQTGDNIIEVTVYNTDGITEYRAAKVTK